METERAVAMAPPTSTLRPTAERKIASKPTSEAGQAPCLSWVKTGKARYEHMFSAVPPTTDIAKIFRHVRFVPHKRTHAPQHGNRTIAKIVEHTEQEPLVHRGWAPGPGREPAPYSVAQLVGFSEAMGRGGSTVSDEIGHQL
jgi:hypothetical protein